MAGRSRPGRRTPERLNEDHLAAVGSGEGDSFADALRVPILSLD